jgi:hypothetical protein
MRQIPSLERSLKPPWLSGICMEAGRGWVGEGLDLPRVAPDSAASLNLRQSEGPQAVEDREFGVRRAFG